jgi:heat-inducible transcriptional repressor
MASTKNITSIMSERSRKVFQQVVENYLSTGEPMGSAALTETLSEKVSAATVRNVMQDLELLGLLDSPHISAGRIPTQLGLRMFVDGILEVGQASNEDKLRIDDTIGESQSAVTSLLDSIGTALSGLTQSASLVFCPKQEAPIKHIEFVSLAEDRTLVVLVFGDGSVENRVFVPPKGQTPSSMREAANFLNNIGIGHTLSEIRLKIQIEIKKNRRELDVLATELVKLGLAVWENADIASERLIVRGRSNLLDETRHDHEIERVKNLFDDLERKRDIAEFLQLTDEGEGVRIFIGSENKLFSLSGSSLIISPYMNIEKKIIGAVGVIGPTRLNYGRIVPIVDYTAQVVGKLISKIDKGRK